MAVVPNYDDDRVKYEHIKIRVLVGSGDGAGVSIPCHWPYGRCPICDEAIYTREVDDVHEAVKAHKRKHHL